MSAPQWLTILGIGDNGLDSLTPSARVLFDEAKRIVAPERVLAAIGNEAFSGKEVTPWTTRVHETIRALHDQRGDPITLLATGDPGHYGIAATLSRTIPISEMRVIPHPSGFSLAANHLGWPLQNVDCLSLHGRDLMRLQPFIEPANRLIALTSNGETVKLAASLLVERGFGSSIIHVLEHMGGSKQRIVVTTAEEVNEHSFADFNMMAIECIAGSNAVVRPRVPGLSNDAYVHDGQITKREVRAVTLAALAPYPDALLWDIGAGCGSVSIEWMRSARGARAIAFEHNQIRLSMIVTNATTLGVAGLEIAAGKAPRSLEGQLQPDAVFIGGGLTEADVFETAWNALRPGGVLVANAVTLEGDAMLINLQGLHGGELTRLDVSNFTSLGKLHALEPRMSVLQWCVRRSL